MRAFKSLGWVGVLACLVTCGCGGSDSSKSVEVPMEATDPAALMGGEMPSDTGAGGTAPTN